MARVTVEDCVEKVTNPFELVMVASLRSREISSGEKPRVERDRDKNPVVALREIAEDKVSPEALYNGLVQSLQRHVEVDEPEEDGFDAMASDPEFAGIDGSVDELAVEEKPPPAAAVEHPTVAYELAVEENSPPAAAVEHPTVAYELAVEEKPPPAAAVEHPTVAYEDAEEDDSKG